MKIRENRKGIILVHTGEGKGKSSSAFGVVFRAAGWGLRICVIQYIKGKWKTGEKKSGDKFDNIEWYTMGDGFTWDTKNPCQDIETSQKIWKFSKQKILSKQFDMVLLDEINYCLSYGWIDVNEVSAFIKREKPSWMHLILTGREAPQEIIYLADTVTEMRKLKHAFDNGITAIQGVEF